MIKICCGPIVKTMTVITRFGSGLLELIAVRIIMAGRALLALFLEILFFFAFRFLYGVASPTICTQMLAFQSKIGTTVVKARD
jgi:hypothetical protein